MQLQIGQGQSGRLGCPCSNACCRRVLISFHASVHAAMAWQEAATRWHCIAQPCCHTQYRMCLVCTAASSALGRPHGAQIRSLLLPSVPCPAGCRAQRAMLGLQEAAQPPRERRQQRVSAAREGREGGGGAAAGAQRGTVGGSGRAQVQDRSCSAALLLLYCFSSSPMCLNSFCGGYMGGTGQRGGSVGGQASCAVPVQQRQTPCFQCHCLQPSHAMLWLDHPGTHPLVVRLPQAITNLVHRLQRMGRARCDQHLFCGGGCRLAASSISAPTRGLTSKQTASATAGHHYDAPSLQRTRPG